MKIAIRLVKRSDAIHRLALYYQEFVQMHETDYSVLDYEVLQIEQVLPSLANHFHNDHPQILLNLMKHLAPYLEQRSLHNITLKYVDISIRAARDLGQSPGWIYLLGYRANWALGLWDNALMFAVLATKSVETDSHDQAVALQALGTAQLNRGDYSNALQIFAKSRKIYHRMRDSRGEMAINAEEAAYYLNKAEYRTAYQRYYSVMEFELNNEHQISDHTLLMMGVISRRLKKYAEAFDYLYKLAKRANVNHSRSSVAVAAHHVSWVLIDQGQYAQAKEYAEFAKAIFGDINDPRGTSDADEQLGLIALAMGEYDKAQSLLEHSLAVRKEIGNQQGYASSLHRMAKLNFMQAQFPLGINYLLQSLFLYYKIRMLPIRRIRWFLQDVLGENIVS